MAKQTVLSFGVSDDLLQRILAQQEKQHYQFLSQFLRCFISDALSEAEAYSASDEEKGEESEN